MRGAPCVVTPSGGLPVVYHPNALPLSIVENARGTAITFAPSGIGTAVTTLDHANNRVPSAKYLADTFSPTNAVVASIATNTLYIRDAVTPANNFDGALVDPATGLFNKLTFTRADATTCATYKDAGGVIKLASANVPRVSFETYGRVLLMEAARTNIVTRNKDFAQAVWLVANTTKNPTAFLAPDLSQTGCEVIVASAGANRAIGQFDLAPTAAVQAASIWLRAGTSTRTEIGLFDQTLSGFVASTGTKLSGPGTVGAGSANRILVTGLTDEWTRVQFVTNAAVAANLHTFFIYPGDPGAQSAGDSVGIWGAQLEAGTFASSTIISGAAATTRAADVCSLAGTAFNLTQAAGTLYTRNSWDFGSGVLSGSRAALAVDDGTVAERHVLYNFNGFSGSVIIDGSVIQQQLGNTAIAANVLSKQAVAYALNDTSLVVNGASPLTDATATMPTTTTLHIGNEIGLIQLFGGISEFAFFGARLSDAQLQALTS